MAAVERAWQLKGRGSGGEGVAAERAWQRREGMVVERAWRWGIL